MWRTTSFWTCVERSSDDRLTTLKDRLLEDDELEASYQVIASPYQEKEQVLDVEPKALPEKKLQKLRLKK